MSWLCPYDHPCVRARPEIETSQLAAMLHGFSEEIQLMSLKNTLDGDISSSQEASGKSPPQKSLFQPPPKIHCPGCLSVQKYTSIRNVGIL